MGFFYDEFFSLECDYPEQYDRADIRAILTSFCEGYNEQDDMNTIVPEAENVQASVSTYPNPAVDVVNVTIENSYNNSHSLRVMNVMGVTLVDTTFEGESTTVDFSRFGAGSYTVSVDGIVARVIKY